MNQTPDDKTSKHLNVLLAEDNLLNQKIAKKMIEKQGHSVVVAANGKEALNCCFAESFDIILMDVQMPEMDGYEATRLIREREGETGAHVLIVALTGHTSEEDLNRCMEAGMDDCLSKPIQIKELNRILEKKGFL